jgi:hypothetical protein
LRDILKGDGCLITGASNISRIKYHLAAEWCRLLERMSWFDRHRTPEPDPPSPEPKLEIDENTLASLRAYATKFGSSLFSVDNFVRRLEPA